MNKVDNKNCVHFDDDIKTNNFNGNSHLIYDDCYENQQENESKGPGGYQLNNLYSCQCGIPEVIKLATNGPGYSSKQFRDGYGWSYCQIDDDSKLRNAKNLTNLRCLNQLQERFNLTTPYLGRGMCDAELELKLQPGEDTFQNRPCNTLAGKDMTDYHFEKYGQVHNRDFNIDKLEELSSKEKEELNNISTQYYDSMESLNYKKALLDTARIQSVEDRHLSKLNTLLD